MAPRPTSKKSAPAKPAAPRADLLEKEPTELHDLFSAYVEEQTGSDVFTPRHAQLAYVLMNKFQRSEANQTRLQRGADSRAERQAAREARAAAAAEKAEAKATKAAAKTTKAAPAKAAASSKPAPKPAAGKAAPAKKAAPAAKRPVPRPKAKAAAAATEGEAADF